MIAEPLPAGPEAEKPIDRPGGSHGAQEHPNLQALGIGMVGTTLWWQERCRRGIQASAAAGDPAMTRLHAPGAVDKVRQQQRSRWTRLRLAGRRSLALLAQRGQRRDLPDELRPQCPGQAGGRLLPAAAT